MSLDLKISPLSERTIMCFVGEGEEFLVAATVAVSDQVIAAAIGIESEEAVHLFLTIAVVGEETACEASVDNLYLGAEDGNLRAERLHPVVDAGADDDDIGPLCLSIGNGLKPLGPQQLAIVSGKALTKSIEVRKTHVAEEIGKDLLLGLPIRIEPQLHQHQQMGMTQETKCKGTGATGIADEHQQGVARSQRPIEIEGIELFHTGNNRLMICWSAQAKGSVSMVVSSIVGQ